MMLCKICGGSTHLIFTKNSTRDKATSIDYFECEQCGFTFCVFLDNYTPEQYAEFYKYPEYLKYDPIAYREHTENFLARSHLLISLVKKNLRRGKVLVYGNGMSKSLQMLQDIGYDAYGYRSNVGLSCELTDLTECKNTFDIVVSTEVAEHFTDPIAEFGRILDVLKHGGKSIASTGCKDRWLTAGRSIGLSYLIKHDGAGHVSFYTYKSVDILANKLGTLNKTTDVGNNKIALTLVKE